MQFAPLYPILYKILKPAFPSCLWSGSGISTLQPDTKTIALTFDDGPHPEHTPRLLDVLEEYGITASFFWLGVCVERYGAIARAVVERGHWIGIHGYNHHNFPTLKEQELRSSLQKTQNIISDTCGISPAKIIDVRPPNGIFTPKTLRLLHQWQYRPVMWSVVPEDWTRPGITKVAQRVMQQTIQGSLIVLHDGHFGGVDCAASTQIIIPQLLAQGYQFVTVDQFWSEKSLLF
jgi:peptidoglycan/xylan/chitin deacetylase (PgdA/CDA1 family)